MHNLEETLKFDHGLTIGNPHAVKLTRKATGTTLNCTVQIKPRGYPRLALMSKCEGFLIIYKVKGDSLLIQGQSYISLEAKAEWLAMFDNPVLITF